MLVIDNVISPVQEAECQDTLEVLEDRHELRSTLLAGQLPPEQWHAYLGKATFADAISDRILHAAIDGQRGPSSEQLNHRFMFIADRRGDGSIASGGEAIYDGGPSKVTGSGRLNRLEEDAGGNASAGGAEARMARMRKQRARK